MANWFFELVATISSGGFTTHIPSMINSLFLISLDQIPKINISWVFKEKAIERETAEWVFKAVTGDESGDQ